VSQGQDRHDTDAFAETQVIRAIPAQDPPLPQTAVDPLASTESVAPRRPPTPENPRDARPPQAQPQPHQQSLPPPIPPLPQQQPPQPPLFQPQAQPRQPPQPSPFQPQSQQPPSFQAQSQPPQPPPFQPQPLPPIAEILGRSDEAERQAAQRRRPRLTGGYDFAAETQVTNVRRPSIPVPREFLDPPRSGRDGASQGLGTHAAPATEPPGGPGMATRPQEREDVRTPSASAAPAPAPAKPDKPERPDDGGFSSGPPKWQDHVPFDETGVLLCASTRCRPRPS
jgi:hypothetical protein